MTLLNELNPKTCFLTTVFPMASNVLNEFLKSLETQTVTNFDLIIVNDGVNKLDEVLSKYQRLNSVVLDASGRSPIENRQLLIDFAYANSYDIAIFGDSDDYFSSNRVEVSIGLLEFDHDIIVNELHMFSSATEHKIPLLSANFKVKSSISFESLLDRNCMGLSNTAVNLKRVFLNKYLGSDISNIIALDWYLYSRALLDGAKCFFTNECITYYRQHGNNIANLMQFNNETMRKSISVKYIHYSKMLRFSDKYLNRYNVFKEAKRGSLSFEEIGKNQIVNLDRPPLWWELPILECE